MQIVGETITGSVDYALSHYKGILFVLLISLSLFAFVFGLAGYQANCIQLGLDQLFEAPSQYLGLFIHYAMWVFQSGTLSFITLFSPMLCSHLPNKTIALMFTILYVIVMTLLLPISYWKHQWFHNEPGHQNPYRTVCGILKFTKITNTHFNAVPSLTLRATYIPSRLDFAKERFGGPFTTEQVENV